nr:MAG TPA: hypothetical protein [Caudoviricetes sp.]
MNRWAIKYNTYGYCNYLLYNISVPDYLLSFMLFQHKPIKNPT